MNFNFLWLDVIEEDSVMSSTNIFSLKAVTFLKVFKDEECLLFEIVFRQI